MKELRRIWRTLFSGKRPRYEGLTDDDIMRMKAAAADRLREKLTNSNIIDPNDYRPFTYYRLKFEKIALYLCQTSNYFCYARFSRPNREQSIPHPPLEWVRAK